MSESDQRIERVARAICQAEGEDPDAEHLTHENETTRVGAAYQFGPKSIPNWHDYKKEATKFVAAFDALNKNS
jgi:hypothetical protein